MPGAVAGDPLFADVADEDGVKDGKLTDDDRKIIGNPNPDFTYGLTNSFTYRDFDISIFVQGSQVGETFNMTNVQLFNGDANTTKDHFNNAWTTTNTPRVRNNTNREISSRFVEDGSYIRLYIAFKYHYQESRNRRCKIFYKCTEFIDYHKLLWSRSRSKLL